MKPLLILDQHFRTKDELFHPETYKALEELCDIVGRHNRPMERATIDRYLPNAHFYVAARPELTAEDLASAAKLKATIEVSGAFQEGLDYGACFARGIEALYIASHAFLVDGYDEAESAALLDALTAFCTQPRFVYSHAWQLGDVLLWDQRAVMHRGTPWPYDQPRKLASICSSVRETDGLGKMRV